MHGSYQVLTKCENGYIGICTCCKEFNFAYKNVLLTFQEESLFQFFNWLIECKDNPEYHLGLPHGRTHVYPSPMHNLFLVYTEEELVEIEQLFMEVRLVLEVRKIIDIRKN
jgi:hypothetical protein